MSTPHYHTGKIRAGILGGAGYTGGELIRVLLNHDNCDIAFVHSRSNAGRPVASVHGDLDGETDLRFTDTTGDADVIFLCMGHGESRRYLENNPVPDDTRIIDLSSDFRLSETSVTGNRQFVYGLPEINRERIRESQNIANPGCFATAIQLGLLPLAKAGLLTDVYTTGITGSTGAGQSMSQTSHFSWRANNIQSYKTLTHQHLHEINESL
ncbi:MAG TPA: N-acetyl-gamma-glutamyl-phosphate reductase, partial [Flavisolibacter sp.]